MNNAVAGVPVVWYVVRAHIIQEMLSANSTPLRRFFYLRREETTLAKKIFLCYTMSAVPGIRLYDMCLGIYRIGDAERQLNTSTALFYLR